ncbi:major capsid protein [Tortoise microvirus 75]|nr:major capsid protein [Tortoise microvirus 75]
MRLKNRMKSDPVPVVRQSREVAVRAITTMPPGQMVPVAAFNLLRMDSCTGRISIAAEMSETYEVLMNRTFMRVSAWFVPHIALERFQQSTAIFERSYHGEPMSKEVGAPVVPFIETKAAPATAGSHAVYKALGLHAKPGTQVNTSYEESYNLIANYVRRNRSKSLPERQLDDTGFAPALWGDSAFGDVVPDFDDAMIAGELPLTVVEARMPVTGIGLNTGNPAVTDPANIRQTGGVDGGDVVSVPSSTAAADWRMHVDGAPGALFPRIFAKMSQNGVTVSLANIDQARALVDWAKVREGYEGHKDAFIIDSLMAGIQVEDQQWFQPMLLDQKMVEIKQLKRMATDGASLEDGVANGVGGTTLGINVPPNTYGGVVMVIAEAIPEQLYERQADPWFTATSVDDLPNYFRDVTNPMPVVEVKNKEVDTDHTTPEGLFGWARRNWRWARWPTRVGGDLFAPNATAATTVARRAIWPTDVANPTLSEDFYTSNSLGRSVFKDQVKDPFKLGIGGSIGVTGLTVVGEVHESEANYDEVRAAAPPLLLPNK